MEQHQQLCQDLLEKRGGEKKLEVWFGSGNNGKTTLFNDLVAGMERVSERPETVIPCRFFQSNDLVVVGVSEDFPNYTNDDLSKLLDECFDFFKKPVRMIVTVNHLPDKFSLGSLEVYRFNHRFHN